MNCIGGNKILLEDGGTKLFFDFGKNFGVEGSYYDEGPECIRGHKGVERRYIGHFWPFSRSDQ